MTEDLISRAAALELFTDAHPLDYISQAYLEKIRTLPSTKIIRRKECRWFHPGVAPEKYGAECVVMKRRMRETDFCSYARRRDSGEQNG